jgi:hypothetical protein
MSDARVQFELKGSRLVARYDRATLYERSDATQVETRRAVNEKPKGTQKSAP